jgi:hypothetical protein
MKIQVFISSAFLLLAACGSDDGDIGLRAATPDECPSGGTTLISKSGEFPVCDGDGQGPPGTNGRDGAPGATGPQGLQGATGIPGAAGPPGPSSDGLGEIVDFVACSRLQTSPLLSQHARAWVFDSGWVFAEFFFSDIGDSDSISGLFPPTASVTALFVPHGSELAGSGVLAQTLDVATERWSATQDGTEYINIVWSNSACIH